MSSDNRSWQERDASAEAIRVQTATVAAEAEAERRRRELLDAPKIAAAQARAEEIARASRKAAEDEAKERAEKDEADRAEKTAKVEAEKAERARQAEVARREARAAKAVNIGVVGALLVALPLQIRSFWSPDRWWEVLVPFVLEGFAWVFIRLAEAGIVARRTVWHYLVGVFACAAFAAGVNVYDGFEHEAIGAIFGVVGGVCSIAGPAMKVIHESGARAKEAKATWGERKLADSQAKQAEAELEAVKAKAAADVEAKKLEGETRQKIENDRRTAHEAKIAADKAAADAVVATQDEQRKALYPDAWKQYELILAANPIGSISRDRAWDEARRAADHPDVWDRYQILALNAPANTKSSDLWAASWTSVKGLPPGQTIETLAAELAAREYVEQTLAEHMNVAGHLAVEELLADIFGGRGEGGGTPAKGGPRKPNGGPSEGATGLVNIGREGDTASRYKHDTDPLADADLEAARQLHDLAPEKFSTPAVAKLLGRSPNYAKRIRDAVRDAANTPKEEQ
ncbi:hypothetical protein ACFV9E_06305 [Streptomyces sp. NPDC059835]|uniref:hypothetical protein n=1 Tax=Streptomyces sp. NPDC059835 TaxID=3346967 RepID=UPI00365CE20C